MRPRLAGALVFLVLLGGACSKKAEAPHEGPAPAKEAPRFYYDLGPATMDVSRYPPVQQEGYRLFLAVCGTCHSPARAINAPYSGPDTWKRYLRRMHVKMESRAVLPSPQDERRILDFLVYDSKVRKLERAEAFQAEQEKLKALFRNSR